MFDGLPVPVRKFVAGRCCGLLKSDSPLLSEQARALCERQKLLYVERRLSRNYEGFDLSPLASSIALFSVRELMDLPYQIDVDESDVIKPHGFAFEELGLVHGGSGNGRPREKVEEAQAGSADFILNKFWLFQEAEMAKWVNSIN